MSSSHGHIKLSRKLFKDDPWWAEPRVFSRFEAWVDVLQLAAWCDTQQGFRGEVIPVARGEVILSVRYAAERWNWSEKAVRTWLKQAQRAARLEAHRETQAGQVYRVVNYETYQSGRDQRVAPRGTPMGTPTDTEGAQDGHKNKQLSNKADKATTSASAAPNGPALLDWWVRHIGAVDPKLLGLWSKPIRALHPLEAIQEAAKVYYSEDEGKRGYRSAKDFFETFAQWHAIAIAPLRDAKGDFTARGRKILGAA